MLHAEREREREMLATLFFFVFSQETVTHLTNQIKGEEKFYVGQSFECKRKKINDLVRNQKMDVTDLTD